jgi:hypothetical protein
MKPVAVKPRLAVPRRLSGRAVLRDPVTLEVIGSLEASEDGVKVEAAPRGTWALLDTTGAPEALVESARKLASLRPIIVVLVRLYTVDASWAARLAERLSAPLVDPLRSVKGSLRDAEEACKASLAG